MSAPYELTVDGFSHDAFRVSSFVGREAISDAYAFDIIVTTEGHDADIELTALGSRATFVWNVEVAAPPHLSRA